MKLVFKPKPLKAIKLTDSSSLLRASIPEHDATNRKSLGTLGAKRDDVQGKKTSKYGFTKYRTFFLMIAY